MVWKQKISVQEVCLLINQEHEILFTLSNLIFPWVIIRIIKIYKAKCLQLCLFNLTFEVYIYSIKYNPYTIIQN